MSDSPALQGYQELPEPGSKRRAASLLPAFEPFSSSPALPRPLKRTRDALEENVTYPTPVPTSSTAILSSSPPRQITQPPLQRSLSTLSERAPLCAVPIIQLDASGKTITMGRSRASCHYQLSANRLISRVHVEACYKPSLSRLQRDSVEVKCTGWNGVKVHCQGKVYQLPKGQIFSSDIRNAQLMVDVHDARVMIQWPEKPHLGPISSDEEEEASPTKRPRSMRRHSTPPSPSPLHTRLRPVSPVSPSPAVQALLPSSPPLLPSQLAHDPVEIYEDPPQSKGEEHDEPANTQSVTQSTQVLSQTNASQLAESQDSSLSSAHDFSENDEENDPIIHSFGPFGANLLPRMASFTAGDSPRAGPSTKTSRCSHIEPLHPTNSPSQRSNLPGEFDVRGHVINQLAFSRLSSTPLSTIMSHLPQEAGNISTNELRTVMKDTTCIGEVTREGKDAAGKPLESEYYYVPDEDEDEMRKEAVVNDLMKPGLRACRKQHKQYFWRKPKKP